MSNHDVQPWERQPAEPLRWYSRFQRFRLAGPTRSIRATWRAERQKASKSASVPAAWAEAATQWNWKFRAEKWDEHELERESKSHAQWQRKTRRRRLRLFDALGRKLRKAVAQANIEALPINVVASAIKQAAECERGEFGEPLITQKTLPTGFTIRVVDASAPPTNTLATPTIP